MSNFDSEYYELQEGDVVYGPFQVYGTISEVQSESNYVSVTLTAVLGPLFLSLKIGELCLRIYDKDADALLKHATDCKIGRDVFVTGQALGYTNGVCWLAVYNNPPFQPDRVTN